MAATNSNKQRPTASYSDNAEEREEDKEDNNNNKNGKKPINTYSPLTNTIIKEAGINTLPRSHDTAATRVYTIYD